MEDSPAFARIRRDVETHPVVLYLEGTPMYPLNRNGAAVAQALDLMGVAYKAINLMDDPEVREAIRAASEWPEPPHLYLQGRLIGGGAAVRELVKSGQFKSLLDAAHIPAKDTPTA